jgi:hypothetical protein
VPFRIRLQNPQNRQHAPEYPKGLRLVPQVQDGKRDRNREECDYCASSTASSAGACQPPIVEDEHAYRREGRRKARLHRRDPLQDPREPRGPADRGTGPASAALMGTDG